MKKKILFGAIGVGLLALALWYIPAVEKIDRVMPAARTTPPTGSIGSPSTAYSPTPHSLARTSMTTASSS